MNSAAVAVGTRVSSRAPPQSGRIEARTGLRMMPTFPRSPLSFRTAGFPRYGWKAGVSRRAFPNITSLSLLPAFTGRCMVCVRDSCTSWSASVIPRRVGPRTRSCTVHPPHPQAHRDFPAWRLRAMPSLCGSAEATRGWFRAFALHSFLTCRPLRPRGVRSSFRSRTSMPTWPSPRSERLGTPDYPAIRFARGTYFGATWFTHLLQPVRLLAPLYGSDRNAQPPGAFTSRLSTDRSPSPLLGMTTTATGLLCWRDLHPLEWQLASLHQIRT